MRAILFRGKRLDNGEWVYGSFCMDAFEQLNGLCGVDGFIRLYDKDKGKMQMYEVYRETVGQFTGMTDKNGKRIFEGDMIQFHKYRGEPDWVGAVKYENCLYIAAGRMPLAYEKRTGEEPYFCPFEVQISSIDKTTIKVIGNIHDNPELIGERKENHEP